jgi:hypothetical protein
MQTKFFSYFLKINFHIILSSKTYVTEMVSLLFSGGARILYAFFISPIRVTCPANLILLI